MAIGDLKNLSVDDLSKLYQDKKYDMYTLRINAAMGEVKDTSQIRKARHDIARILTVLRQRELAATAAQKDK
jgi:large subunit ribosomal protein L29